MLLFEKTYPANTEFYHGSWDTIEKIREDGNIFVTDDLKYAIVYSRMYNRSRFDDKVLACASGAGFIYTLRLKKDLDIFDANNEDDLAALKAVYDVDPTQEKILKEHDFLDLEHGGAIKREELINILKDLGFDGFYNNEEVGGTITDVKRKTDIIDTDDKGGYRYFDGNFEAYGAGICIFDASNVEFIKAASTSEVLHDNDLKVEDCVTVFNLH